jgi:hypothetical protein
MTHRLRLAWTVAAASLLAPAGRAAAQRAYVAATSETIVSTTEERQDDPPVHLIYIENRSTVPVTVFNTSLTGCENVKQICTPQPRKLKVRPGQRELAVRVEPKNPTQGFGYRFGFSWRADSSSVGAVEALAKAGDARSQEQLAAIRHADSLDKAQTGVHYHELARAEFSALAGRATALRADPDSLVLTPGERTTMDRIRLLLVDAQGAVLGATRWVRWQAPGSGAVQFVPPDGLVARAPGRATLRFSLAPEAESLIGHPLPELAYVVTSAYPPDPHAPTVGGVVVDPDKHAPLACVRVALEDSAQNVVARGRTDRTGSFMLNAPRPGTYRVRVEAVGWAPAYGAAERADPDDFKQHQYAVSFVDQLLMMSRLGEAGDDFQHATPSAFAGGPATPVRKEAPGAKAVPTPVVRGVTFESNGPVPTLVLVGGAGGAPPGASWAQFTVDSTGTVRDGSVLTPPDILPPQRAALDAILPRLRFTPARQDGVPTCELARYPVAFR